MSGQANQRGERLGMSGQASLRGLTMYGYESLRGERTDSVWLGKSERRQDLQCMARQDRKERGLTISGQASLRGERIDNVCIGKP